MDWLRIIPDHPANCLKKRARRRERRLEDAAVPSSFDPEREALDWVSFAESGRTMEGLTQLERQVLSQRFAGELAIAATATIMNRSIGAVKFRQYTAPQAKRRKPDEQEAGSRG